MNVQTSWGCTNPALLFKIDVALPELEISGGLPDKRKRYHSPDN